MGYPNFRDSISIELRVGFLLLSKYWGFAILIIRTLEPFPFELSRRFMTVHVMRVRNSLEAFATRGDPPNDTSFSFFVWPYFFFSVFLVLFKGVVLLHGASTSG